MTFSFHVTVELERESGKFASRDDLSLANAMCWACWPHDCPRVVLSTTGLVSCAARYLEWVDSL